MSKVRDLGPGCGAHFYEILPAAFKEVVVDYGKILPFGVVCLRGRKKDGQNIDIQLFVAELVGFRPADYQAELAVPTSYPNDMILFVRDRRGETVQQIIYPWFYIVDWGYGWKEVMPTGHLVAPDQAAYWERVFTEAERGQRVLRDNSPFLQVGREWSGRQLLVVPLATRPYNPTLILLFDAAGREVDFRTTYPFRAGAK